LLDRCKACQYRYRAKSTNASSAAADDDAEKADDREATMRASSGLSRHLAGGLAAAAFGAGAGASCQGIEALPETSVSSPTIRS
jgi:hypothetical protein